MPRPVHYVSHSSTLFFECYRAEVRAWVPEGWQQGGVHGSAPSRTTNVENVTCHTCLAGLERLIASKRGHSE
jgi:hypothetical protein